MKQLIQAGDSGSAFISKWNNNFTEVYNALSGAGMYNTYTIQAEDDISESSWWNEQSLLSKMFLVESNFDFLGKTVTLPSDIVIIFKGGIWSNGIIQGNKSLFNTLDEEQCFTTNLTLSGTWKNGYITPQNYGAITNASPHVYENGCSAAIQKCLDSLFSIKLPAGYYYVENGLNVIYPKAMIGIGGQLEDPSGYVSHTHKFDNTRFYTDQNIDMISVKAGDTRIQDIIIDYQGISICTKSAVRLDMNYALWRLRIDVAVVGNRSGLATEGNGITGIKFDCENLTVFNGCVYGDSYFKLWGFYMKYGIHLPDRSGNSSNTWMNNVKIESYTTACKQHLLMKWSANNIIRVVAQDGHCLHENEKDLKCIQYWGKNTELDIVVYDASGDLLDGMWKHAGSWAEDYGSGNTYVGNSASLTNIHRVIFGTDSRPASPLHIENPDFMILNNYKDHPNGWQYAISAMQNMFTTWVGRGNGLTINHYDGTGYDFDANLGPSTSLSPSLGIEMSNTDDLFNPRGLSPKFKWTSEAGLQTDFVEIVLTGSVSIFNHLSYLMHYVLNKPRLIQTNLFRYGTTWQNYKTYPGIVSRLGTSNNYVIFQELVTQTSVIVIRLIGNYSLNGETYIDDIFMRYYRNDFNSLIDAYGGQTIYGNLTLKGGSLKQLNIPVYSDNTAAKAGGLVAGSPYRTATGQMMIVYD